MALDFGLDETKEAAVSPQKQIGEQTLKGFVKSVFLL